jgi:hypothetical protein
MVVSSLLILLRELKVVTGEPDVNFPHCFFCEDCAFSCSLQPMPRITASSNKTASALGCPHLAPYIYIYAHYC